MRYADKVERAFEVTLRSGDEYMVRCPKHEDRSASLQVNVTKGLFVCFSCGWKGSIRTLLGNIKEPEPEITEVLAILDAVDTAANAPRRVRTLPEATLRRYNFPTDYWAGRGFTEQTVAQWDLGYDAIDDDAIIPIRNQHGDLISITRRRLHRDSGPKYLYQKGFQRSTNLFGSWKVGGGTVAITEGPLDAVMVWQAGIQAVAQYGSSISAHQVNLLHQMGVTRAVLFYDNDKAGQSATEQALSMLRGLLVYVVQYGPMDPKDPGGMTMNRIKQAVHDAKLVI